MVHTHQLAKGKKSVSPNELLNVFRQTLHLGSVRLRIYDTRRKATFKQGRLTGQAQQVFDEILKALAEAFKETKHCRKDRLEKEFAALCMPRNGGAQAHADFRSAFADKLCELEYAEAIRSADTRDNTDIDRLRRDYLGKLTPELRSTINKSSWPLDGEDNA